MNRREAIRRHQARLARLSGAPVSDPTRDRRTAHHDPGARVTGQVESPHPAVDLPAETAELLRTGKLEQTCPECGRVEAAGAYCSGCSRQTGPDDWYRNNDQAERRQRAPENPRTPVKRGRGRPKVSAPTLPLSGVQMAGGWA